MAEKTSGLDDARSSCDVHSSVRNRATCVYCGSTGEIQELHLVARPKHGRSAVLACTYCTQSKGSLQPMVWLRWLKRNKSQHWERIVAHNRGRRNPVAQKVHTIVAEGAKPPRATTR